MPAKTSRKKTAAKKTAAKKKKTPARKKAPAKKKPAARKKAPLKKKAAAKKKAPAKKKARGGKGGRRASGKSKAGTGRKAKKKGAKKSKLEEKLTHKKKSSWEDMTAARRGEREIALCPAPALGTGIAHPSCEISLSHQPLDRDVECTARHGTPRPLLQLLPDRHSIGPVRQAQDRQEHHLFEFTEEACLVHVSLCRQLLCDKHNYVDNMCQLLATVEGSANRLLVRVGRSGPRYSLRAVAMA